MTNVAWKRIATGCMFVLAGASAAPADVHLACTFPSLPALSVTYPDAVGASPLLSVLNRPQTEMTAGAGSSRFESATVDGYHFQFHPKSSSLEVRKGETLLGSEAGKCVRIGGPDNGTPISLVEPSNPEPSAAPEQSSQSTASTQTETGLGTGQWSVTEKKSKLDDTPLVVLTLLSDDQLRGRFGGTATPSMVVRCMENTTTFFISAGGHFLSDIQGYGKVDYRIDQDSPGAWRMSASTNNEVLGFWNGGKSIPQIQKLMSGAKLFVRLTPYNESPLEFGFNIAGLTEAVKPLRNACNW